MGYTTAGIKSTRVTGIDSFTGGAFGQEVVCVAEALRLHGWSDNPGSIALLLNANDGWTKNDHELGPGLIDLEKLAVIMPRIYLDGRGTLYSLVQGQWGVRMHTMLRLVDGTLYDPESGQIGPPSRWQPNGIEQVFGVGNKVSIAGEG